MSNDNTSISTLINQRTSTVIAEVINGATKQQLLDWIAANDNITADAIRELFCVNASQFTAALSYDIKSGNVDVDFSGRIDT